MGLRDIWIKIKGKDDSGPALKGASKNVARLGKSARVMGKMFKGGFNLAIRSVKALAVGVVALGATGIALIKLGSDAEETGTKFDAVFRDIRDEANETARSLANDFNITSTSAKKLLGDTADLLTGFGFSQKAALDLADSVQRLGIDLASFTNFSGVAEGASQALTKLLLGETEQAKSLGIVVRQGSEEYKNAVKQKMKDLGVTTLQAKALTALEMATAQSKNAIGDYARTSRGAANAMRNLRSAVVGMLEKLGITIIKGLKFGKMVTGWATALRKFGSSKAFDNISIKLQGMITDAKTFVELLAGFKQERSAAIKALGAVLRASLKVGAEHASITLKKAAPVIGELIGKAAKAIISGVSTEIEFKKAEEQLVGEGTLGERSGRNRIFGVTVGTTEAERAQIEQRIIENRHREMMATVDLTTDLTLAQADLKAALANLSDTIKQGAEWRARRTSLLPNSVFKTSDFASGGIPSGNGAVSPYKFGYSQSGRVPTIPSKVEQLGPTLDRIAKATEGTREDINK